MICVQRSPWATEEAVVALASDEASATRSHPSSSSRRVSSRCAERPSFRRAAFDSPRKPFDTQRAIPQHHHSYGTQTHRRKHDAGSTPARRRARVPTRTVTLVSEDRLEARVRRSVLASSRVLPSSRTSSCASFSGSSHGGAAVSNTAGRGFDTFRACARRTTSPGHQHLDNCIGIVIGVAATRLRDGPVAPWGAAACRAAVVSTQGVRFPPDPPTRVTPDG